MAVLLEGIRSISLPCTLAILLPGAVLLLAAGRRAAWALVAFVVGTGTIAWARATGWWPNEPNGVTQLGVALLIVIAFAALVRAPRDDTGLVVALPAAVTVGALTAWMWRPCVGRELGDIVNRAPDSPVTTLVPMIVYIVGISLPLVFLAALPHTGAGVARIRDAALTSHLGLAAGLLLGLAVATGLYDEMVITLFRQSL